MNTEIALALQAGSTPLLESLTLNYVVQSNSMSILADAVAQNGRFSGLCQLDLAGEDDLDPSPLFHAIADEHKCPALKSLDVFPAKRSIVALGDALAAGAFRALTDLSTPELDEEEEENVIACIHVLEARALPLIKFVLRTKRLYHATYVVLADALFTPAFASLRELNVWESPTVVFNPLMKAFRAGAGKHLETLVIGTSDEAIGDGFLQQLYYALTRDECPKLSRVSYRVDGKYDRTLRSFLRERRDRLQAMTTY